MHALFSGTPVKGTQDQNMVRLLQSVNIKFYSVKMLPFSSWRLKAGSLAMWCRGTFSTHTGGLDGMEWDWLWVHDTFQKKTGILGIPGIRAVS